MIDDVNRPPVVLSASRLPVAVASFNSIRTHGSAWAPTQAAFTHSALARRAAFAAGPTFACSCGPRRLLQHTTAFRSVCDGTERGARDDQPLGDRAAAARATTRDTPPACCTAPSTGVPLATMSSFGP